MNVRWDSISRDAYEGMVGVLLSRIHNAQRIDGQGGDEGRDAQLVVDGWTELFEFKFLLGRVSKEKGRRRQVEKSLARAAERNPHKWSLVVPIDPTPGELKWFDGLRAKYPFELEWKGLTWLESSLAEYPSIVRFYDSDGYREVFHALAELNQEQALLARGIPDVIDRLHALRNRIDEIDPHYRLDISLESNTTIIKVVPRYPGAEKDRPIFLQASFSFPATREGTEAAERARDAFDFGTHTVIPAEFVEGVRVDGLPGVHEFPSSELTFGPADIEALDLEGRVFVRTPDGTILGSLPVRFAERRRGLRGGTLSGVDASGLVKVDIRFALETQSAQVNLSFSQPDNSTPGMVLPALRVLQHMKSPNGASLELAGHSLGEPMTLPETDLVPTDLVRLIEDLDRVQAFSRTAFAIPDQFTSSDLGNLRRASRLIAGERIELGEGSITTSVVPHSIEQVRAILEEGSSYAFAFETKNYSVEICGVDVPFGPATLYLRSARVGGMTERSKTLEEEPLVDLELSPTDGTRLEVRLNLNEFEGS